MQGYLCYSRFAPDSEGGSTIHCTTLGIDVAKQLFQLHGVDEHGQVVLPQRVTVDALGPL